MPTPCWLSKCSSSRFLPRTSSAFQRTKRRALPRSVLLGRVAIFGHEQDNGFQGNPRAGCPCGEGGDGLEEPTSHLHTCLEGKVFEIRNFLECGGGNWVGNTRVGVVGLAAAVLTLAVAFFLGFLVTGLGPAGGLG